MRKLLLQMGGSPSIPAPTDSLSGTPRRLAAKLARTHDD
jgi:hypothetical protein